MAKRAINLLAMYNSTEINRNMQFVVDILTKKTNKKKKKKPANVRKPPTPNYNFICAAHSVLKFVKT